MVFQNTFSFYVVGPLHKSLTATTQTRVLPTSQKFLVLSWILSCLFSFLWLGYLPPHCHHLLPVFFKGQFKEQLSIKSFLITTGCAFFLLWIISWLNNFPLTMSTFCLFILFTWTLIHSQTTKVYLTPAICWAIF